MPPHNPWYIITPTELAMIREELDRIRKENTCGETAGKSISAIQRSLECIVNRLN